MVPRQRKKFTRAVGFTSKLHCPRAPAAARTASCSGHKGRAFCRRCGQYDPTECRPASPLSPLAAIRQRGRAPSADLSSNLPSATHDTRLRSAVICTMHTSKNRGCTPIPLVILRTPARCRRRGVSSAPPWWLASCAGAISLEGVASDADFGN